VRDFVFNFCKIGPGAVKIIMILFVPKVSDLLRVDELTPITVRTSGLLKELAAELGLVSRRNVLLLLKLMFSMSKGA